MVEIDVLLVERMRESEGKPSAPVQAITSVVGEPGQQSKRTYMNREARLTERVLDFPNERQGKIEVIENA